MLGTLIGSIYLANRFCKFSFINNLCGQKKIIKKLFSYLLVAIIAIALYLLFGRMNMMLCLLHLTVIWLVCDGVAALIRKFRKSEKKHTVYVSGGFALVITTVYLSLAYYQANHIFRTQYTIATDKEVGSFRIALISDSHLGNILDGARFREELSRIEAENPDVLVVVGDYVDDDSMKADMVAGCEALGDFKSKYGVYYVFGNHDRGYYNGNQRGYRKDGLVKELKKNQVCILEDEATLIDNRIYLIGRKDKSEASFGNARATMLELTEELDEKIYSVVLDHQPADYAGQMGLVDLVLSGHTHGGQLFPLQRMGEWLKIDDKSYGLEERGGTNFLVTSGISDWALKFRTGCKSEYVIVDIVQN